MVSQNFFPHFSDYFRCGRGVWVEFTGRTQTFSAILMQIVQIQSDFRLFFNSVQQLMLRLKMVYRQPLKSFSTLNNSPKFPGVSGMIRYGCLAGTAANAEPLQPPPNRGKRLQKFTFLRGLYQGRGAKNKGVLNFSKKFFGHPIRVVLLLLI